MMPAAPFVGAVTMRPPEAFSSFTASAKRLTHSMAHIGSVRSVVWSRCSRSAGARRRTFSPPGRIGSVRDTPLWTHSSMTAQMASSWVRSSSRSWRVASLASMSSAMLRPAS